MGCKRQFANVSLSFFFVSVSLFSLSLSVSVLSFSLPPSLSFINIHCRATIVIWFTLSGIYASLWREKIQHGNSYGMRHYRERIQKDNHKARRLLYQILVPFVVLFCIRGFRSSQERDFHVETQQSHGSIRYGSNIKLNSCLAYCFSKYLSYVALTLWTSNA